MTFRFLWADYQLKTLRTCYERDVPDTLKGLPKTLDGTYENILNSIPEMKQKYAHCMFQWLTVSSRPLSVQELAEVISFNFDAEASGIPKFEPSWRESNAELAVRSACRTLVNIINIKGKKVVQLSHASVREYLMSDRIAKATHPDMLRAPPAPALSYNFQVLLKPAHTLLAKASLSVLLQLDRSIDKIKIQDFPLAQYAAEYWDDHARFEGVSSDVRDGMDCLFDKNKPHFAAWIWLYDVASSWRHDDLSPHPTQPNADPLYYAVLLGFSDLAEDLLDAHPQDVNATGGWDGDETPLHAALYEGQPNLALLLLGRGADVEYLSRHGQTAVYVASSRGYAEVVQSLINYGAKPDVECNDQDAHLGDVMWTPLLVASKKGRLETAMMLLEYGADVNYQDNNGMSPLHLAARRPSDDLALLLLNYGANPNALDTSGNTPLHDASSHGHLPAIQLLFDYGANVDAPNELGWTPLQKAAEEGHHEVVELLLGHGANVNAQTGDTALQLAAFYGRLQVVEVLLRSGADPHAPTNEGETPLQLASKGKHTEIVRLLSKYTGESVQDPQPMEIDSTGQGFGGD